MIKIAISPIKEYDLSVFIGNMFIGFYDKFNAVQIKDIFMKKPNNKPGFSSEKYYPNLLARYPGKRFEKKVNELYTIAIMAISLWPRSALATQMAWALFCNPT